MVGGRRVLPNLEALLVCLLLLPPGISQAVSSQEGGSGLVRVDRAYSLPITGFLMSSYGGYFSNDFTPGARLFTFQPSLTKGLGGGFEISGTLPLEGLTSSLEDSLIYSRRFDLRGRDPIANLRWTGPIGTSRFRAGAQGSVSYAFGEEKRPGGTLDPDDALDLGVKGLLSMEFGSWNFPMQLHVNGGYWWSRNDGAFYYREMPTPLPITPGPENNVFGAGVALQGGLQRMTLFAELTTEQFLDARGEIASSENLWRLTPGVRTKLSSSIAATAALSFDLSQDDERTAFNPDGIYPDVEFRLGLALGQVLRRLPDLPSWRAETEPRDEIDVAVSPSPAESPAGLTSQPHTAKPEPAVAADAGETLAVATPIAATPPAQPAAKPRKPEPVAKPAAVAPAPAPPPIEVQVQAMQRRLEQLEMSMLLDRIQERLANLERMTPPDAMKPAPATTKMAPVQPATPLAASATTPAKAATTPPETETTQRLDVMQQQIQALLDAQKAPVTSPGPTDSAVGAKPGKKAIDTKDKQETKKPAEAAASGTAAPPTSREQELAARVAQLESAIESARAASPVDRSATLVVPVPSTRTPAPRTVVTTPSGTPTGASTQALQEEVARELERSRAARMQGSAPSPDQTGSAPTPNQIARVAVEAFPLAVGEKTELGVEFAAADSTWSPATYQALDTWAERLASSPRVRVMLLVHGTGVDRTEVLARSDRQAKALREYLVRKGAQSDQVVGIGMGLVETGTAEGAATMTAWRVELQRVR